MAEEEVKEAEDGDEGNGDEEGAPKKSKASIKLLGGVVGLLGAGVALAVMAMPKKVEVLTFEGPAMHQLFADGKVTTNAKDDNFSRYFVFTPSCSYLAYDLSYPATRSTDPHYDAILKDSINLTISRYRLDELMSGESDSWFPAEIEAIVEPILFPVHLGETPTPYDMHEDSGLRLGDSQEREGTFRGAFYEHTLHVDIPNKTLILDEGPEAQFSEGDYNALVEAEDGSTIYIDVSAAGEDFVGEIHIGVMGRIRRMFMGEKMAQ